MAHPYYVDPAVTIWHANALRLPLDDNSVDLIVTSPPYFKLRSYTDGGQAYDGQVGREATPEEFIDTLAAATREMMRVIKPSGSIFVNLGDRYDSEKSLMLLPERYRIRCRDDLGLVARSVIVWDKPSSLPDGAHDRVRRSHEDWVHLTKSRRYFADMNEVRTPYAPETVRTQAYGLRGAMGGRAAGTSARAGRGAGHPRGALPGSVWAVPVQPLRIPAELGVEHLATFPMEWPRRLIKGWSPTGVCVECGEGRQSVIEGAISSYVCNCSAPTAPTVPADVLDPFAGTGTTGVVAKALGRHSHLVDLSLDYCRVSRWRISDPQELAKAAQAKPPVVNRRRLAAGGGGRRVSDLDDAATAC